MSKLICDVCGTSYPENAAQCPICGSAKNAAPQSSVAEDAQQASAAASYNYVKGGRFSKGNVRKHSSAAPSRSGRSVAERRSRDSAEEGTNKGLMIVAVVLLLAIIAVVIYIATRFFLPADPSSGANNSTTTTPSPSGTVATAPPQTTEPSTLPPEQVVSCTGIQLSNSIVEITEENGVWLLEADLEPVDTTDKVTFKSLDESVVTVSDAGLITAVGKGQTTVVVTCGSVQAECLVHCSFGETEPTTQPTTAPTAPPVEIAFNTKWRSEHTGKWDVTLKLGSKWNAYVGNVPAADITWVTDDPKVATIENGVVQIVGAGKTEVHAIYGGVTYTCIIRCNAAGGAAPAPTTATTTEPETEATTGTTTAIEKEYHMVVSTGSWSKDVPNNHSVTINVGASFALYIKDAEGEELAVSWDALDDAICSISGNTITGLAAGNTTVAVNVEGTIFQCKVIVK